jgi:lipid-A-disaccharide synthase|uniref:Lipid-A-disaccharide synthase n=1 Tax=Desulfobacca acetoxidans TaxID=60893 RepID=A0A7V6A6Z1_9BACT
MPDCTVLIIAGEASGDAHGARLVSEIRRLLPQVQCVGIGGEALAAHGVELLARAEDLAVVGLTEVAARLPAVVGALREVGRVLKRRRPVLAILIDFPDFNFLVARLAKRQRVPVMYYISPQVWAWRRRRVRTIARLVARMVVIFPFEEDFYRREGVPVTFVGHPFMETLPILPPRENLLAEWGLDPKRLTLALLPGSRASEIERHLPIMLAAARIIRQAIPEVLFLLPLASTAPRKPVEEMVGNFLGEGPGNAASCSPLLSRNACLHLLDGQAYAALAAAHLAIVASGTVTVEAALAGTPAIIIYRLGPLTYQVARQLIRVEHIGMANLLAGEGLYPELIQEDLTPERLAAEVLRWLREPERLEHVRQGLARVVKRLGPPGASARAARVAVELIKSGTAPLLRK